MSADCIGENNISFVMPKCFNRIADDTIDFKLAFTVCEPPSLGEVLYALGAIQVLRNPVGDGWVGVSFPWVGGCQLSRKKRHEGVRFNVISVTGGWVGVKFLGKKRYVTLGMAP